MCGNNEAILRKRAEKAEAKAEELEASIKHLGAPPLAYARVVILSPLEEENEEVTPPEPLDFTKGRKVKVIRGEEEGTTGVIMSERPNNEGFVDVQLIQGGLLTAQALGTEAEIELIDNSDAESIKKMTISYKGEYVQVGRPDDLEIEEGCLVALDASTMTVVEVIDELIPGQISYVVSVLSDYFVEVDLGGSTQTMYTGTFAGELTKGDRVVIDASARIVTENLGPDTSHDLEAETHISWDDIGGLEEAKRQMQEVIELPYRNPDIFAYYKKKPAKGVLLYGPPGCGKTMLAKAAATALAEINEERGTSKGFFLIKGPEILDKYVGIAEARIRQIFQKARDWKEENGFPAIIFIDECDAILNKRGSGRSSDVERTIVPMFLAEMDGMEDSGAIVVLATNRADILDPAIVRDGRVDRKIKISRPTSEEAVEIFKLYLKDLPVNNGYSTDELAELGSNILFSDAMVVADYRAKGGENRKLTLGNITNGGMIASIVDQTTSLALRRDLESGGEPTGISKDDLNNAILRVRDQNLDLDHTEEIKELAATPPLVLMQTQ